MTRTTTPQSTGKAIEQVLLGDRQASRMEAMLSPTSQEDMDWMKENYGKGIPGLWPRKSQPKNFSDSE